MRRRLVTLKQAEAELPWATVRFCRTLITNGVIGHHKVAGKVLVDLAELDAVAERGRIEPPTPMRIAGRRGEVPARDCSGTST